VEVDEAHVRYSPFVRQSRLTPRRSGVNKTSCHHSITSSKIEDMRTTIDLDDEILRVIKDLSRERSQTMGHVLSELARKALQPAEAPQVFRNGIPLLPRLPGAKPVTSEAVKELLELDN
jgi:hypothetical protein